ncbi:unnamed protein product [Sphagnum troendelagicum]|uniref:Uncharacterized protein n=1 Tax=Sphagnum troendelagicum TaxID=128251 RepID=A0ABP0UBT9_9BRYO
MGSTSTALGAGTNPVSALTAGVFLGVGISIVAMGRLLQYVHEMGQRSPAAGSRDTSWSVTSASQTTKLAFIKPLYLNLV